MHKVSVIGAGGHVGFPLSLVLADSGYNVTGIDISESRCLHLNNGYVPYKEDGAQELLRKCLDNKSVFFTSQSNAMKESDVIAIMIGTPVDGEGNPRVDDILSFVEFELCEHLEYGNKLIVLRSTVAPGTTELIKNLIEKNTGLVEGRDFYLVFAPERVAQGVGITESRKFPQMVGAFSDQSFEKAKEFFGAFVPECIQLEPREAEFGKLMTNMYRYVTFALANEFYMIGAEQNVDIHKVIAAANKGYPRMSLPSPGPNVGGPCLFKDGKFLLETVQYDELIRNSFTINEGMPQFLFNMIMKENEGRPDHNKIEKIGILGATFKADCDDIRNSLSFKFAKICKRNGIAYDMFDPYVIHVDNVWPTDQVGDYDAFIVMTPHTQFKKFYEDHISKTKDVLIVDAWKFLDASKNTKHGIFYT